METEQFTGGTVVIPGWRNCWVQLILRLAIGAVFVYAGVLKMLENQAFSDSVSSFKLVPAELINGLALGLPPFEILLGAGLMLGWQKRAFALGHVFLTLAFAFALGAAIARGLVVDCGCFGSGKPSAWSNWISLGRDAVLFSGAMLIYFDACLGKRSLADGIAVMPSTNMVAQRG